jgi:hypothetical protein
MGVRSTIKEYNFVAKMRVMFDEDTAIVPEWNYAAALMVRIGPAWPMASGCAEHAPA